MADTMDTDVMLGMSLDDISKQRKGSQPKPAKRKPISVKKAATPAAKIKKTAGGKATRKSARTNNNGSAVSSGRKGRQDKIAPYSKPGQQGGKRNATNVPNRAFGPWRVNVTNLASATTLPYLIEGMQGAGIVSRGEIAMDVRGQSLGHGSIDYLTKEGAEVAARDLNGTMVNGKRLKVVFVGSATPASARSVAPKTSSSAGSGTTGAMSKVVKVNNLAWNVDEAALKKHFATAGRVVRAEVAMKGDRSLGHAKVFYNSVIQATKAAAEMTGSELNGRPITVSQYTAAAAPALEKQEAKKKPIVVFSNIDASAMKQDIVQLCMTAVEGRIVVQEMKVDTEQSTITAKVSFSTQEDAMLALKKLHGAQLLSSRVSLTLGE